VDDFLAMMNTHLKPMIPALAAVLAGLTTVDALSTTTRADSQLAAQSMADTQDARAQQADYVKGLAAAVRQERRNDAWAAQKEAQLRTSYATAPGVPPSALKSVECRSSKCDLQIQSSAEPGVATAQQMAVSNWLAVREPCGFTIARGPALEEAPGVLRIFVNCGQQRR
jgi:hypothetical protein